MDPSEYNELSIMTRYNFSRNNSTANGLGLDFARVQDHPSNLPPNFPDALPSIPEESPRALDLTQRNPQVIVWGQRQEVEVDQRVEVQQVIEEFKVPEVQVRIMYNFLN